MIRRLIAATAVLASLGTAALAADPLKIGIILPYSGQFADLGSQMQHAIELYIKEHGDEVEGRKIELIQRDVGGIAPDVAKRLAQELVVRDKVDVLVGFALTPNAGAAAEVSKQAQKFMVVMNAGTSFITEVSPYVVRTSFTSPSINYAFGKWAATKGGVKEVYTLASDYGPGHDAQTWFEKGFTEEGGKVVGSDKLPVANPDFSAYVQRVKDANPEGIYIFVPGGAQPPALGKALAERGLTPKTTKIMGQGELSLDETMAAMGPLAEGIVTVFHYTTERQSPENDAFVKAFNDNYGRNPDVFAVGAYDGMHVIYEALKKTKGDSSGEALVEAAKGMKWESPRGPVEIDPETREIIQNAWIREVQMVDGKPKNVVIDEVDAVKDPTHGMKK